MIAWFNDLRIAAKVNVSFGIVLTLAMVVGIVAVIEHEGQRLLLGGMLVATLALGLLTAMLIRRAVCNPLINLVAVLKQIAEGNLNCSLDLSRRDEIGAVWQGLSDMQGRLRNLLAENHGQVAAIGSVQALAEFQIDGTITSANEIFLTTMGYTLEEIRGRHHSMFVPEADRATPEYKAFWEKMGRGEHSKARYQRLTKDGRTIWLDAIYSPISGADGKPYKVVKYASDVTSRVLHTRQLDQAVVQVREVIKSASEGNLTARVSTEGKSGELLVMAESINSLLAGMADIVGRVKSAAADVHRGAEEISEGNAHLAERTEQQASSLEETASSMEQMTSTVKQNADNASQANQLAAAARDQAEKGGAVTADTVRAMSEIHESSKKIVEIIGVIDEIAFQTNLLALNAAVEAARAGEQGRGFAVVASEVRSLAGRSATAAKEIKDLIQDSVRKVEGGSQLVTRSGEALEQIVSSVKKVSDIVAEIAAASREQSSGIEQVDRAIAQMDQMTQQNSALVEQGTAASSSMTTQARTLNEMMARYRISDAHAGRDATAPARPERRSPTRQWAREAAPRAEVAKVAAAATARAGQRYARLPADNSPDWEEF